MKTKRARSGKTVSGGVQSPPSSPSTGAKPEPLRIPPLLLEGDGPDALAPAGPGEKFALGATPPAGPAPAQAALPESYGTARLLLLASDPRWLYANWDLTRQQQRHFNSLSAEGHLAVRVCHAGAAAEVAAEVPVHPESRHWSIEIIREPGAGSAEHAERKGTGFVGELGYYSQSGEWVVVAKSEPVAPFVSDVADKSLRFVTLPTEAVSHRPPPSPTRIPAATTPPRVAWLAGLPSARDADFPVRGSALTSAGFESCAVPSTEPEWTAEQERALAEMLRSADAGRLWMSSLELAELVRGEREAIFSPLAAGPQAPKPFWLQVNTELIVYGATEPDAQLTLGGQPIQLRPDGTFSCRFALPDGEHELAVTATSTAGETRQAVLSFSRRTQTEGEVGAHPQGESLEHMKGPA
jgi:hypothetical protein